MTKYEYHIEPLPVESMDDTLGRLNALGAAGWQFVSNFPSKSHAFFQRESVPVRDPYEREAVETPLTINAPSYTEHSKHNAIDLLRYIASDHKIEAIKAYRALTGFGLVDSKNAVEKVTSLIKR